MVLPVSRYRLTWCDHRILPVGFQGSGAAKSLFRRALRDGAHRQPRVINTDLAPTYASALPELQRTGIIRRRCKHRPVQYLNNILEQDHRAIKKRVNAKQGLRFIRRGATNGRWV